MGNFFLMNCTSLLMHHRLPFFGGVFFKRPKRRPTHFWEIKLAIQMYGDVGGIYFSCNNRMKFGLVSYDDPRFLWQITFVSGGKVWTLTGVPAICIASRYFRDQWFEGNCCFFAHVSWLVGIQRLQKGCEGVLFKCSNVHIWIEMHLSQHPFGSNSLKVGHALQGCTAYPYNIIYFM